MVNTRRNVQLSNSFSTRGTSIPVIWSCFITDSVMSLSSIKVRDCGNDYL